MPIGNPDQEHAIDIEQPNDKYDVTHPQSFPAKYGVQQTPSIGRRGGGGGGSALAKLSFSLSPSPLRIA
tara:strand:- start:11444 stop:11650 length:207 start_codon:yes stop_codon:yes gene_type:complete